MAETIYTDLNTGTAQKGSLMQYYDFNASSNSVQSIKSIGAFNGAAITQGVNTPIFVQFSLPLTSSPIITNPNAADTITGTPSFFTASGVSWLSFMWTPSVSGTNEIFTFTNVTNASGPLTAPPLTVLSGTGQYVV
ncbi:MAG: hypothetical protein WB421_06650, partial [Terriglobales bacterium]